MRTIYKVFKKPNLKSHTLCLNGFDSKERQDNKKVSVSYQEGEMFYLVQSDWHNKNLEYLKFEKYQEETSIPKNTVVDVSVELSFENNATKRLLTEEEALNKFLWRTGLESVDVNISCLPQRELIRNEYPIKNLFGFSGKFRVVDSELFKDALESGIGKHRSYGYGMINFSHSK